MPKKCSREIDELRQSASPSQRAGVTVYGLADIAYEREEYQNAEPRLKGALQEYPQSAYAIRGSLSTRKVHLEARHRGLQCAFRPRAE